MTASEMAALAYAVPPIAPQGLALVLEVVVYIFSVLTTVVIFLRVWVRAVWLDSDSGRRLWGMDDSLAVLGFVSLVFFSRIYLQASSTACLYVGFSTMEEWDTKSCSSYDADVVGCPSCLFFP